MNTPPQCKSQCINDECSMVIEHDYCKVLIMANEIQHLLEAINTTKASIMANDHQRLLEAIETLLKYRSRLTITSTC